MQYFEVGKIIIPTNYENYNKLERYVSGHRENIVWEGLNMNKMTAKKEKIERSWCEHFLSGYEVK